MSVYRRFLEQIVMYRVPGVGKVNSEDTGLFATTLYVGDERGRASEELLRAAEEAIGKHGPVHWQCSIKPYEQGPKGNVPPCPVPSILRNYLAYPPTVGQLEDLLRRCINECVQVKVTEASRGKLKIAIVTPSGAMVETVAAASREVVKAIFGEGMECAAEIVTALPSDVRTARRFGTRMTLGQFSDSKIAYIANRDEERFVDQLPLLIEGRATYQDLNVSAINDTGAVFAGANRDLAAIEALLALYSTVYLAIPASDTLQPSGVIHQLARQGRVVPILNAPLHEYPAQFVLSLIEDPDIRVILPRQLDGITTLTLARQFPFWRDFRNNPQLAAYLSHAITESLKDFKEQFSDFDMVLRMSSSVLDTHIDIAQSGEQLFAEKGFMLSGNLTAGGAVNAWIDCLQRRRQVSKETAQGVTLEAHGYSMNLVIARATGAAYHPAYVHNEFVLGLVAHLQSGTGTPLTAGDKLPEIIGGLRLARPEGVTIEEYLKIINCSEAERLRHILNRVLLRAERSPEELASALEDFNRQVEKWAKSRTRVLYSKVDLLGILLDVGMYTSGVSVPGASSMIGLLMKHLGARTEVVKRLEEKLLGRIAGVSPAAIRVGRIRSALKALTR